MAEQMKKYANLLQGEVLDLTSEIALISPTDTSISWSAIILIALSGVSWYKPFNASLVLFMEFISKYLPNKISANTTPTDSKYKWWA